MRFTVDMEAGNEVENYKQLLDVLWALRERISSATNWNEGEAKLTIGDGGPVTFNGIVIGNWKVEDSIHKGSVHDLVNYLNKKEKQ
jgi:hypothetical protein